MGDPQWLVYWEILKITWMHLGYPHFRKRPYGESTQKISFGGIPNSRNVLCLQIFLKRVMRSQALETPQLGFRLNGHKSCWTWPGSAPKRPRPSPEPSPEPCWTWPGSAPKPPQTFSRTFSGTLLNLTWLCTKASQTFSGTFSGTLLNLTWLCTKASQTFTGTFSGALLNLTWLSTKASREPSSEPSPEPCWTWPGSAPKPPRPSPEPSPEPRWTWPRPLHQCTPELFWAEDRISLRCWGYRTRRKSVHVGMGYDDI